MSKVGINLAVFASGNGSNFSAIIKAVKEKKIKVKFVVLVSDKPEAFVVKRAQKERITVILVRREDFASRADFEAAIIQRLKNYKIDLIALAGFMRMLSCGFVKLYRKRIINIHPSLLPAFKGAHAILDALEAKVSFTGVTVHFVDKEMDHGPLILQRQIKIKRTDTLSSLEKRIHALEHELYPQAIKLFLNGRIKG
jgi:phosphoribosylglycinamide formyltransferase-1